MGAVIGLVIKMNERGNSGTIGTETVWIEY